MASMAAASGAEASAEMLVAEAAALGRRIDEEGMADEGMGLSGVAAAGLAGSAAADVATEGGGGERLKGRTTQFKMKSLQTQSASDRQSAQAHENRMQKLAQVRAKLSPAKSQISSGGSEWDISGSGVWR